MDKTLHIVTGSKCPACVALKNFICANQINFFEIDVSAAHLSFPKSLVETIRALPTLICRQGDSFELVGAGFSQTVKDYILDFKKELDKE